MSNEFEFELNGQKVYTGMQTPETIPLSFAQFPKPKIRSLSDIAEIIKDSKRIPIERAFANEIEWFNQGKRSSCNAYMIFWILATMMWRQTGKKNRLSPEWVYSLINGGKDQGSMLDKGMIQTFEHGMPTFNPSFYQRYNQSQFSMEEKRWATDSAEDHCFGECYKAPDETFEGMMMALYSCLADGGAVGMAVHVGKNYMKSGEVAGFDRGPGNHAICGADLHLKTPNPKSIEDIEIVSPQSWGARFAKHGFTRITSKHCYEPGTVHAYYCVTAVSAIREVIQSCRIK